MRRPPRNNTTVTTLSTTEGPSHAPGCTRDHAACHKTPPSGGETPNAFGNCDDMITIAAPDMKPITTGALIRRTTWPRRAMPNETRIAPTMNAMRAAMAGNSAGLTSGSAAIVRRLVTATGPVCKYGEDASSAKIKSGNAEANSPMYGGSCASSAYASDCGMRTIATLVPAMTSVAASRGKCNRATVNRVAVAEGWIGLLLASQLCSSKHIVCGAVRIGGSGRGLDSNSG